MARSGWLKRKQACTNVCEVDGKVEAAAVMTQADKRGIQQARNRSLRTQCKDAWLQGKRKAKPQPPPDTISTWEDSVLTATSIISTKVCDKCISPRLQPVYIKIIKLLRQTWSCPSTLDLGSWRGTPVPGKIASPLLGVCCVPFFVVQLQLPNLPTLHTPPLHPTSQGIPCEPAPWQQGFPSFPVASGCVCPYGVVLCCDKHTGSLGRSCTSRSRV